MVCGMMFPMELVIILICLRLEADVPILQNLDDL